MMQQNRNGSYQTNRKKYAYPVSKNEHYKNFNNTILPTNRIKNKIAKSFSTYFFWFS